MKVYKSLIILGIIIIVAGMIFHLQGKGIVGPESSFMYSNSEWITNGLQIVFLGILIIGAGMFLKIKSNW
jgi:uncharacterized membrane protein